MLHPDPITSGVDGNVNVAMESGALFARKFDLEVRSIALENAAVRLSGPHFIRVALPLCSNPVADVEGVADAHFRSSIWISLRAQDRLEESFIPHDCPVCLNVCLAEKAQTLRNPSHAG